MFSKVVEYENYTPTLGDVEKMGLPIFNDWWDTYVPEYKPILMQKILRAYHFHQIGSETPERFVYNLNEQLSEIMPYYNQLYASELIKFNPLLNHSINASGRNIENILTKANTTDDKFSKAIRDFVGSADKATNNKGTSNTKAVGAKDYSEETIYTKDGLQTQKETTTQTGTEDETNKLTINDVEHTASKSTQNTDTTVTGTDDKTVTETPGETTTKKMEWGGTESTTVAKDEVTTSKGKSTKNWTEVTDDDSKTDTTTHLTENSTLNRQQDYADTPQKKLQPKDLRKDYLTNVTWTDEDSDHTADTKQGVVYADDMTKTHGETGSEDVDGTKKNNDTENLVKGGTDTETTTKGGTNKTVTDVDTTDTTKGTVTTDGDQWKTDIKTEDEKRDLKSHDTTESEIEKPWEEKGHSETSGKVNTNDTTDQTTINDGIAREKTREVSDLSQSSVNNTEKTTEETTDTGTSSVQTGFMNVSPSALLEAFRRTFINVDKMIIDELRINFMLVY